MHNLISMSQDLVTAAGHVAASVPDMVPAKKGELNTDGLVKWVVKYIVPIVVAAIGVGILTRSSKGETGKNVITVGNMLVGIMVIAGGALLFAFGSNLVNVLFS